VVSSVGLKRFYLLGSSWSSRAGMSPLGCMSSFTAKWRLGIFTL